MREVVARMYFGWAGGRSGMEGKRLEYKIKVGHN